MDLHDSGYTTDEVFAILDELIDEPMRQKWGNQAGLVTALALGLLDGDVIETSEAGTVMTSETREQIDATLTRVRAAKAAGKTLSEALEG